MCMQDHDVEGGVACGQLVVRVVTCATSLSSARSTPLTAAAHERQGHPTLDGGNVHSREREPQGSS